MWDAGEGCDATDWKKARNSQGNCMKEACRSGCKLHKSEQPHAILTAASARLWSSGEWEAGGGSRGA